MPGDDIQTVNIEIRLAEQQSPSTKSRLKKAFLSFGQKNGQSGSK